MWPVSPVGPSHRPQSLTGNRAADICSLRLVSVRGGGLVADARALTDWGSDFPAGVVAVQGNAEAGNMACAELRAGPWGGGAGWGIPLGRVGTGLGRTPGCRPLSGMVAGNAAEGSGNKSRGSGLEGRAHRCQGLHAGGTCREYGQLRAGQACWVALEDRP